MEEGLDDAKYGSEQYDAEHDDHPGPPGVSGRVCFAIGTPGTPGRRARSGLKASALEDGRLGATLRWCDRSPQAGGILPRWMLAEEGRVLVEGRLRKRLSGTERCVGQ